MKLLRKPGVTSEIWQIFIADSSSTTGAGLTGLTNASSGLTAYYHRDTDTTATAISLASMTVGTFTSGGFKEIDATNMPGWYQFCPTNAALAAGAASCAFHLKGATNMAPLPIEVDLKPDVNLVGIEGTFGLSTATLNLTKLNIVNSGGDALVCSSTGSNGNGINASGNGSGNGLLATGGGTGHGLSAVGGATSGSGFSAVATLLGDGIVATAVGSAKCGIRATAGSAGTASGIRAAGGSSGHGLECVGGGAGNGVKATGGSSSGAGVLIASTSGDGITVTPTAGNAITLTANGTSKHGIAITGGTAGTSHGISVAAGSGGLGFSLDTLTASGAVTISGATSLAALSTSGTTTLNALTISNALTVSGTTSLAALSTSGTATLNALTISNALTVSGAATITGAFTAANASNNIVGIDVAKISGDSGAADNCESFFDGTGYAGTNNVIPLVTTVTVLTALTSTTRAEPGQGAPAATTTPAAKLDYLYKAWRNKHTQSADEYDLYDDAGTTVDQKATVADSGTLFTRGEVGSGP